MTQTTPRDWLDAGLVILSADGPEAVTIDALCSRLDVTKGSFYHHFDGYADYKTRLLQHFEAEGTGRIIETVEAEPTPQTKLRALLDIVVSLSKAGADDPEVAFRAWAQRDEAVAEVLARVDERRIEYVESLFIQLGERDDRARRLSQLLYAVIVGCEQLKPPLGGEDLQELFELYLELVDLAGEANGSGRS